MRNGCGREEKREEETKKDAHPGAEKQDEEEKRHLSIYQDALAHKETCNEITPRIRTAFMCECEYISTRSGFVSELLQVLPIYHAVQPSGGVKILQRALLSERGGGGENTCSPSQRN